MKQPRRGGDNTRLSAGWITCREQMIDRRLIVTGLFVYGVDDRGPPHLGMLIVMQGHRCQGRLRRFSHDLKLDGRGPVAVTKYRLCGCPEALTHF